MTEYPQLHALLCALLQLSDEDTQLPLPVIINIHRAQLRAPLEQLVSLASPSEHARSVFGNHNAIMQAVASYVSLEWPELNSDLYIKQPGLVDITGRLEKRFESLPDDDFLDYAGSPSEDVLEIIYGCLADFRAYDPIYLLHQLTWRNAELNLVAWVLELELGVNPQVRESILQLAGKTSSRVVLA
jgi:hypothetical protein